MIGHRRWSRQVDLFAAGVLAPRDLANLQGHLDGCARCRAALDRAQGLVDLLSADAGTDEPPLALAELNRRVHARLRTPRAAAVASTTWRAWAAGAAAAVALMAVGPRRTPLAPSPAVSEQGAPLAADGGQPDAGAGEALLRRMEGRLGREQAARYLADAQDLLVTVAAPAERCRRSAGRVDVGQEARRSRELLARRALVVDLQQPSVASASPVLQEVEQVLREVAALEACARRADLRALEREIGRRRLLMRIDLATRELLG